MVGTLLLAPVIARRTLGVLAAGFVAAAAPLGRLARGNVTRNPRRTANTAGALTVGMALVGAASVLASSATASTRSIVDNELTADFTVKSATYSVPAGVIGDLGALRSVATVDPVRFGSVVATTAGTAPVAAKDTQTAIGLPPGAFGRSVHVTVVDGSLDSLADGRIAVQKGVAKKRGWTVGDSLTFTSPSGNVSAKIGAIVDSQALNAPILPPEEVFVTVVPPARAAIDSLFVSAAPGTTQRELRADLVKVAAPYAVLSILDKEDFAGQLAAQVNQVLVILYALLGLSIVIAILGIVNTLALSVIERTREIGLMRAVGLGRLQLAGIVAIESVLTAVFGTLVGVGIGVVIASAMPTVFADKGLTTLVIPWVQLATMVALAASRSWTP